MKLADKIQKAVPSRFVLKYTKKTTVPETYMTHMWIGCDRFKPIAANFQLLSANVEASATCMTESKKEPQIFKYFVHKYT
jgi:hypothetical protein